MNKQKSHSTTKPVKKHSKKSEYETSIPTKKKFHEKDLIRYQPITETQRELFELFKNNKHLFLKGFAGTGKSFLSLYLSLKDLLSNGNHSKITIIRSIVSSRDVGFLPGTLEEKITNYEEPYRLICDELFEFSKSYDNLKESGKLEFLSSSFLRGCTLDDSIIIVDEVQNMTFAELDTVMTRVGKNSRIIFCGDTHQKDIGKGTTKYREESGIEKFFSIIEPLEYKYFDIVEFSVEDCVRSDIVKQYLISKQDYELSENDPKSLFDALPKTILQS